MKVTCMPGQFLPANSEFGFSENLIPRFDVEGNATQSAYKEIKILLPEGFSINEIIIGREDQ